MGLWALHSMAWISERCFPSFRATEASKTAPHDWNFKRESPMTEHPLTTCELACECLLLVLLEVIDSIPWFRMLLHNFTQIEPHSATTATLISHPVIFWKPSVKCTLSSEVSGPDTNRLCSSSRSAKGFEPLSGRAIASVKPLVNLIT